MDSIEEEQDNSKEKEQVTKQENVSNDETKETKVVKEIMEEVTGTTHLYKEISIGHSDKASVESGKDNKTGMKDEEIKQSVENKSDKLEEMKKIINQEIEKDKQEEGKVLLEIGDSPKEIKINVENVLTKKPNINELEKEKTKKEDKKEIIKNVEGIAKPNELVFIFKEENKDTKQNAEKEKLEKKGFESFVGKGIEKMIHEFIYKNKDENKEDVKQGSSENQNNGNETIEKGKGKAKEKFKIHKFIYNKDNESEEKTINENLEQNIDTNESEIKNENETELVELNDQEVIFSQGDEIEEMRKIINQEIQKENEDEKNVVLDLSWEIIEVAVGNSGNTAKVFRDSVYDNERELKIVIDIGKINEKENKENEIELMKRIINQGNTKGKGKILIDVENITKEGNTDAPKKISDKIKENMDKEKERENKASEHEDINKEIDEIRSIINQGNVKESDKGRILIDLEKIKKEISIESKDLLEEEIKNKDEETKIVEKPKKEVSIIKRLLSNKEKEMKKWKLRQKVDEKNIDFNKDQGEISRNDKEDEKISKYGKGNKKIAMDKKETKEIENVKDAEEIFMNDKEQVELLRMKKETEEIKEVDKHHEGILSDEKDNEITRNELEKEEIKGGEQEIEEISRDDEDKELKEKSETKDKIESDQENENVLRIEKDNVNIAKDHLDNEEIFNDNKGIKNFVIDEKEFEDVFKGYNKLVKNETYEKVELIISSKEVDIIEENPNAEVEEDMSDKEVNLILIKELKEEEKEFEGIRKEMDEEEIDKNEMEEMKKIINQEKMEDIPRKKENEITRNELENEEIKRSEQEIEKISMDNEDKELKEKSETKDKIESDQENENVLRIEKDNVNIVKDDLDNEEILNNNNGIKNFVIDEKEFEDFFKGYNELVKNETYEKVELIISSKEEEIKTDSLHSVDIIEENPNAEVEEDMSDKEVNLILIKELKEEEKEFEGIRKEMDEEEIAKNEMEEMKKIINQEKMEDIPRKKETGEIDNQNIDMHDNVNFLSNDAQQCSSKVNKNDVAIEDNYTEIDLRNDIEDVNLEQNDVFDFNYVNKNDLQADKRSDEIDLDFENMDSFGGLNILDTKGDDVLQVLMDSEKQGDIDYKNASDDAIVATTKMDINLPKKEIDMDCKNVYEFNYAFEDENLSIKNKYIIGDNPESNRLDTAEEYGLQKNIVTEQNSSNNDKTNVTIVADSTSSGINNLNVIISVATIHAESPTTVKLENKINETRLHFNIDSDNPDVKRDIKKSRSFDANWLSGGKDDILKALQTDFLDRHKNKNYLDPLDIVEPCDIVKKTRKSVSFDASFLEINPEEKQDKTNEYETKSDFKEAFISQEHDVRNLNLNYKGEDILEVLTTGCGSNFQESEKKFFDAYEKVHYVPIPPLRKKRSPSVPILNSYTENKNSFENVKLVYSNSELEIIPPPRRKLLERKQRLMSQEKNTQNPLKMNNACRSYSLSDINAFDWDDIFFLNYMSEIKLLTSLDDSILLSDTRKTDDDAILAYRSPYTSYDDSVLPSSYSRDVSFTSPETSKVVLGTNVGPYNDVLRASVALMEKRSSLDHGGIIFPPKIAGVKRRSHTFTKGDTYLNELRDSVRLKKKSKSVGSLIRRTFTLNFHDENPPCLPNLFKKYRKRKKHSQCDLKNLSPISEEIDLQRSLTSESFKSIFIGDEVSDSSYVERCIGCDRNMSCVSLTFPDLPEAYLRKSSSSIDVSQYASNSEIKASTPLRRGSATCLSKGLMLRRLKEISHESSVASLDSHTLKRAKDLLDKSLGIKSHEEPSLTNLTDFSEIKKGSLLHLKEFGQRNNNPAPNVPTMKNKNVLDNSQKFKTTESESSDSSEPSKLGNISSLSKFSMPHYFRRKIKNRSASLDVQSLYLSKELWNKSLEQSSEQYNDTPVPPKRSKSKQSINSESHTDLKNIDTLDEEIQPRRRSFAKPRNILKLLHEKHSSTESFKSIFSSFNTVEKGEKKSKENVLSSIFDYQDKKNKIKGDKEVILENLSESEIAQKKRLEYLKSEGKNLDHISHKIHDIQDAQEEYHEKVMRSFIRRYSHDIEALNDSGGKLKELTNMYQVNIEKNEEEMEKVASKEILGFDNIDDISINKLNLLDAGKRRESLGIVTSLPSLKEIGSSVRFSSEDDSNSDSDEPERENKNWEVYKYPCKTAPDFVNKENLIKECLDGTFRLKLQNYVKGFKPKVDSSLPDLPEEDTISTDSTEILAGKYERNILQHLKIKSNDSENCDQSDLDDVEYIRNFARKYELDLMNLFEIKGKNFLKLADTEIAQRRASVYNFRTMSDSDNQVRNFDMDNVKTSSDFYNIDPSLSERGYLELSPEILHSVNGTAYTPKENSEIYKNNEFKIRKRVSIAEPEIIYTKEDLFSSCDEETEPESDDDIDESDVNESFKSNRDQMDFDENLHAPAYRSQNSYENDHLQTTLIEEKRDSFHILPSKVSQGLKQDESLQSETNDSSENGSTKSDFSNIDDLGKEYEDEILSQVNRIIPQIENRLKNISKFSYLNMKTNEHGLIENPRLFKTTKLTRAYSEDYPRTILPKYPLIKRTSLDSSKMHLNVFQSSSGQIPNWFRFQPLSLTKLASNVYFRNRKMEMYSKMMDTYESINKFILANNYFGDKINSDKVQLLTNSDILGYEEPFSPVKHRSIGPSIQHLVVARRDSTITYESSRPDSPIPEDVDPNCELEFHEALCLTRSPKQLKENIYHFPYFNEDDCSGTDTIDASLNGNETPKSITFDYEGNERVSNKIVPNPLTNRQFIISPVQVEENFTFEDIPETEETEEFQTKEVCNSQYSFACTPQHSNCKSMQRTNAFDDDSSSILIIHESFNGNINTDGDTSTHDIVPDIEPNAQNPTNDIFIRENLVPDHLFHPVNELDIIFNESSDSSECLSSDDDTQTVRHISDITNTIKDKCSLNCECQFPSDDSDPVKILALHVKPGSPEYELRTWFERQDTPEELKSPSPVSIPKWVKDEDLPLGSDSKSGKDTPSPGPPSEKSGKLSSQSSTEGENNFKKEDDRTQKDRCVEIYPETIRQRQRNMAPSPSKVDIKNWEPSAESTEDEKKFLPSVKALRNQFENGKAKPVNNNNNILVRTSSDSSTNSLVLNSLDTSSGFGSLTSSQVTLEQTSSGPMPSQIEEDEAVEPIFSQFRSADDELKEMMSKPPSTQGWNPHSLLKRLYYVPDAPKMHRREAPFVNIEGYLEKLPSGRKKATFWNAWKRRYFVAKDGILFYYQNNQTEKPNMKLPLMGGKIEIMDPSMISVEDGQGRESRNAGMLGIDDGKGHYVVVRCTSRQEAERWKEALETHTLDDYCSHYVQPWPRPTNPTLLRDTLVIDIGSCSVRAGVLTSQPTLPQLFFPSVVATNRETKSQIWGIEALMPDVRPKSAISFPIRPSHKISKFSVDLNAVSSLLQKTFNDLKVDPQNYNIQLSVPRVLNPHTQAELLKILFDKFGVKAVNMTHQSILALYAYNATSGIIVDIGERLDVVPVIDGYIVDGGVSRVPYGGYRIMDHLRQFLFQKNISLLNEIDSYIIRQILENICYCAQHYNTEKQRCTLNPENFEKLAPLADFFPQDSQFDAFRELSLDFGRFQATEGLFNPDAWGLDHPGLHKLVHKAIQECSMDIRKELSRSIFLVGGVSQMPGIADRLTVELDNLTPPAIRPKVHASPYRYHASYLGACILAESDAFAQSKITKEEWTKQGNSALRKWAL